MTADSILGPPWPPTTLARCHPLILSCVPHCLPHPPSSGSLPGIRKHFAENSQSLRPPPLPSIHSSAHSPHLHAHFHFLPKRFYMPLRQRDLLTNKIQEKWLQHLPPSQGQYVSRCSRWVIWLIVIQTMSLWWHPHSVSGHRSYITWLKTWPRERQDQLWHSGASRRQLPQYNSHWFYYFLVSCS